MRLRLESNFVGLYNVTIWLKDGTIKRHTRVEIDNEQRGLGNIRVTDEKNNTTLYVKSDIKKWSIDSKNCQR